MGKAKIVGGQNAAPHEFPWLVSIRKKGGHWCGGSILNDRFVLSAGHCFRPDMKQIKQFSVILGVHNIRGLGPEVPEERRIKNAVLHPGDRGDNKYVNDIAVLELDKPINWSNSVKPACLPVTTEKPGYSAFGGVNAIVAGWGSLEESKYKRVRKTPDVLQKVEVLVLTNTMCNEWFESQNKKTRVETKQVCAGLEEGGKDACLADSGGPLMVESHPGGPLMVIGVISTGIGCGRPLLPGIYTRVSDYVSWIMQETKSSQ